MPYRVTQGLVDSLGVSYEGTLLQGVADPAGAMAAGRVTDMIHILGDGSTMAVQTAGVFPYFEWTLTAGVFYSAAALVCFAGFCLLMYYFKPHALAVVNIFRGTLYIDKLLDEHNFIFETFRRLLILLGLVLTGLIAVRYMDSAWGSALSGVLPRWAFPLGIVGVWVALVGMWLLQNMMLRMAGWLTYSGKFTSDLVSLRNLVYGLMFLFSVPLMLCVALAGYPSLGVLSVVLFTVVGAVLIFLLIRTYMLFLREKISILCWILYLCAVEILPVSFLVILTLRNIG